MPSPQTHHWSAAEEATRNPTASEADKGGGRIDTASRMPPPNGGGKAMNPNQTSSQYNSAPTMVETSATRNHQPLP